jgi:hypothetical protein
MDNLALHIQNSLQQPIQIDYYQILGVNRNSTIQQICTRFIPIYTAIAISRLLIIPPFNIKTPTKLIGSSLRLQKPLMFSTIVLQPLCSRKEEDL